MNNDVLKTNTILMHNYTDKQVFAHICTHVHTNTQQHHTFLLTHAQYQQAFEHTQVPKVFIDTHTTHNTKGLSSPEGTRGHAAIHACMHDT